MDYSWLSTTITIHAFTDANWAGGIDDYRSPSGYGIYLCPKLITWSSKKQPTVTRSSTKAEYKGLANVIAEVMCIFSLLHELKCQVSKAPTLWCDNLSVIYLTANLVFHSCMKHVAIDFHFLREFTARKAI